jgi:EmrB/QacA subfamily drug resistance transporter
MEPWMDADKKKYLPIVISAGFAAFMTRLDIYIVNISLPTISRFFNVSVGSVSQIITYNLFALTCFLLIFGKLADRIGLKKIYVSGLIVFSLSSLLCSLSPTIEWLIVFRCLEGIGGAMLIATAFAMIPRYLPSRITGWGYGIQCIASMLGITVGAPIGGVISNYLTWQWIFLINVPVGICAVVMALKILPKENNTIDEKGERQGIDIAGAVLSMLFIFALLYGLSKGRILGWSSPIVLLCFLGSLVSFILFILVEKKASNPLLDLSLFRSMGFNYAILASCMVFACISGIRFIVPFYLEYSLGVAPALAGIFILLYSLINMIVGPYAGRTSDIVRPRILCVLSMLMSGVVCLVFALILQTHSIVPVIIFLVLIGISFGSFFPPNNNLVMGFAVKGKHGIASAVYNTTRNMSLIIGVCIFEIIFSQSVPQSDSGAIGAGIPFHELAGGFRNTFIAGGALCFIALTISLILIAKKVKSFPTKPRDLLSVIMINDERGSSSNANHRS